ncbi:Splicing factor 3A subunit 1-like [Oopsacas minuta]|uniref:Splicing factor 3A subunit 1-like n=1 Tax=Oopsacas minuta TaxID=111878 RepID=A0AAV7JGZ3_9METZ|nr:Splicing factor 3A subunit 1-like [Oopsacas minuta]
MPHSNIVPIHILTVYYSNIFNGFKSINIKIEQRTYMKIRTLLKVSPTDVYKDLDEVYRDTAILYPTVVDWARRLREGRMSIENAARIERPVSSASDKNILEVTAVLEEDTHITLVEIADALGSQRELLNLLYMIIWNSERYVLDWCRIY